MTKLRVSVRTMLWNLPAQRLACPVASTSGVLGPIGTPAAERVSRSQVGAEGRDPQTPAFCPTGGQYLAVSAAKGLGGRAARLVLPLGRLHPSGAAFCLSFRHKVAGPLSGTLQVFVRKHRAPGAAVWGRASGQGWRHTQVTLRGADIKSVSKRWGGGLMGCRGLG